MDDFARLEKSIKRIGKFPTKELTQVVKKAANPILTDAKSRAPVKSGAMIKAMILKKEKSKPGKRVYQVTFDKAYNEVLAKESKDGKRSYYPASQEYGWITRSGRKIQGKHFLRDAADANARKFERDVIDGMFDKIAKEWKHG